MPVLPVSSKFGFGVSDTLKSADIFKSSITGVPITQTDIIPRTDVTPALDTASIPITDTILDLRQSTKQDFFTGGTPFVPPPFSPSKPPSTPPPFIIPPIPSLTLGSGNVTTGFGFGVKQKKAATPDLLSIFAGIKKKGKSKFTTGLSLRGVAAPVAKRQREFAKLF